jgi:NAD+ kinase
MKRVGFVAHAGRPAAVEVASGLSLGLREQGVMTRRLTAEPLVAEEATDVAGFASGLDLIVSVGGDGTFLRAAQIAADESCPVMGVKVGRLGFLTEIEPEEAMDVIGDVLHGRARIEQRMALIAEAEGSGEPQWALNEVIVEKGSRHRLVKLAVRVDGTEVCTFSADGVIVATSTGSTAYSFSARGPIVSPLIDCLVVTPVAAHMVFDRSLVMAPGEQVSLEVVGEEAGLLSADGRGSLELPVGTTVRVSAAPHPTFMVRRSDGKSFFAIVREKFGLPDGVGP